MLHHGKYAPVPTILRPVAGIKFEISQFKHLCYLCSIVHQILSHVIWNYFSFNFIQIKKKNIPTFPEFGLHKEIN